METVTGANCTNPPDSPATPPPFGPGEIFTKLVLLVGTMAIAKVAPTPKFAVAEICTRLTKWDTE